MNTSKLYVVAGCNGAGKTTASYTILPETIDCKEFVNADEIAKGLSPFQPEKVAFEAGRIMISRIDELIDKNETFAFETTLSTRSHKHRILTAREKGFTVVLLFFWISKLNVAKKRVKARVKEGGHNIPVNVIERRYYRGVFNLFDLYLPIVDDVFIFDNSYGKQELIAHKMGINKITIVNGREFKKLKDTYNRMGASSRTER